MTAKATFLRPAEEIRKTAAAAIAAGDVHQLADGRAAVYQGQNAAASGDPTNWDAEGQFTLLKTTSMVLLDGGRAYWDRSAGKVYFRKINDQDFYLGRVVGDAASGATTCVVNINVDEDAYDLDLARDSFVTAILGTQALGGLALNRRGGAHDVVISSTNEAQKVDALSTDGFATAANAIIEFAFCVPNDGAGTVVDVSVGAASATHATDADSIAKHLLMHLDANNTAINFQSKDGTTTVAATDSTKTYTEGQTNAAGTRKEVWMDMRNPASVGIYVDGVAVLTSTTFDVSASTSDWKLLLHIEKTAAADTYEFQLDWLKARFAEQ